MKVTLQDVPDRVNDIADALKPTMPLEPTSVAALIEHCGRRVTYAVRLRRLQPRLAALGLTAKVVRTAMEKHGEDSTQLLDAKDRFAFGFEQVGNFLDLLEGRWFEDDFSGERRRADRFSTRGS